MNMEVGGQWGQRTSVSFELVPREENGRKAVRQRRTSVREGRMEAVAESKLFFVLEMSWNFAQLVRNVHGTRPRRNFFLMSSSTDGMDLDDQRL